jgi:hypothetical protein
LVTDHIPGDGYVHAVEDISIYKIHEQARKVAEEQLFEEKERAQVTLNSIGDAVLSISSVFYHQKNKRSGSGAHKNGRPDCCPSAQYRGQYISRKWRNGKITAKDGGCCDVSN